MTQELRLERGQETIIRHGDSMVELRAEGEIAVSVGGAWVEVHADGSIEAHSEKDVEAYTSAAVHVHAPAGRKRTAPLRKPG